MALTDENGSGMVMPVAPMYGGGGSGFGNGFGSEGWWIILLFIILGGWGNGFGNGNGGGGVGGLYPWMNQTETINDGFRDQMLNSNITSIRDGLSDISTQLCNGFSNVQMSAMQNAFGLQNAINTGVNGLQSQLASCCCENRLGTADLKYTIATEACADRAAVTDALRDVIEANTASTQRILDQLCSDKIDAKNEKIADLERQLTMANLAASQNAQTAAIRAGQVAEIDAMYQRLRDCPVPTMPVYGMQPIFSCPNNSGCGCGGNF